jgi:hypothetical protein
MRTKRSKASGFSAASTAEPSYPVSRPVSIQKKLRKVMPRNGMSSSNEYVCAIEKTQNGKYNVRFRVTFASSSQPDAGPWALKLYFLASSFNGAMKKLEEALQILQKNEEKLRFWAVERTDDPNVAGELLHQFGLWLDRRQEFPRKVADLAVARERQVPASQMAQVRRTLADSVAQQRFIYQAALAGD